MANIPGKPKFYHVAAGSLLARYIRFVARTSWQTREMTESFEDHEGNHPCIIGMWHGQFMLLPLIKMSDVPVDVMLARHGDAEAAGPDAQAFRHAADPRRRRRLPRQGPRRHPRLPRRRAVAARWPHGGHDGRRAGRRGAACGTWHRHGGAPVGAADPAGRHRHLALPLLQHLEPDDAQPALLGDGLCRRSARHRAARCRSRAARGLPAGGRGRAQHRNRSRLSAAPAPTRCAPPRIPPPATSAPSPACASRPTACSPAWPVPWRRPCCACASGTARKIPCAGPSGSGRRAPQRPAGRLAWFHAASVGETNAILPLMAALAEERPLALLPAHHRHRHLGHAGRRTPHAASRAPVCAARRARVRAQLPRPLAPRPRRVHRVGDLAQPDPGKLGARHPAGAGQRAHDQALLPPLAPQSERGAPAVQPLRAGAGAEREPRPPLQDAGRRLRHPDRQPQGRRAGPAGQPGRAGAPAPDVRRPLAADRRQHARRRGPDHRRRPQRAAPQPAQTCAPSSPRAIPSAAAPSRRC